MAEEKRYGADLIVESLANHGIDYVFGIPGAKIDRVFETLEHPKTKKKSAINCRPTRTKCSLYGSRYWPFDW